jgi:hypothetical protein
MGRAKIFFDYVCCKNVFGENIYFIYMCTQTSTRVSGMKGWKNLCTPRVTLRRIKAQIRLRQIRLRSNLIPLLIGENAINKLFQLFLFSFSGGILCQLANENYFYERKLIFEIIKLAFLLHDCNKPKARTSTRNTLFIDSWRHFICYNNHTH